MLSREFQRNNHVYRIEVTRADSGWEVRNERDGHVVTVAHKTDWHQVERALALFDRRAGTLESQEV